jgi:hypothetical protein
MLKRGGDRFTARLSDALTATEARGMLKAALCSLESARPLNAFITVHWEQAGIAEHDVSRAMKSLADSAFDYFRNRGVEFASIWVLEGDVPGEQKGAHAHWLLHIPGHFDRGNVLRALRGRVAKIANSCGRLPKGVFRTMAIPRVNTETASPETYRVNLANVLAYILKGANEDQRPVILALLEKVSPDFQPDKLTLDRGGRAIGKRTGISKALTQNR